MSVENFSFLILLLAAVGNVSAMDTDWWKSTLLYEIYVPSFKDSNGDGLGDIKGVTKKLDHFVDLGIETLYLSPFYKSPMKDLGFDISNYTDVNPIFGTLADFDEMMAGIKKRGLKLIADLVINHSSDEHDWFIKSVWREWPYTDYYIWADAKGWDEHGKPIPPNNWFSIFEGCGWEWNWQRRQFYFHQFAIKQPDLNLRNENVRREIKNILKFWMDRGVSGFRLDATKHFLEDKDLRDEPYQYAWQKWATGYYDLKHIYTTDLWESYEFIHELREYIRDYTSKGKQTHEKLLVAEAYTSLNYTMAYYDSDNYLITHFPFNFAFVGLYTLENSFNFNERIHRWLRNMPKGATPNWVAENHDNRRIGSRMCEEYMDIVTITIMTLPGVACVYYGEEIGMLNSQIRTDQRQDPNNDGSTGATRDGERLPMQWDDTMNAGFTSRYKSWLPVHPNYWRVNVEAQKHEKVSRYQLFKTLAQIRKKKTMRLGEYKPYIISEWVYAFTRTFDRHESYITVLNLGSEIELVDLHDVISNLPANLEVAAASINAGYVPGDRIRSIPKFPRMFSIRPLSGLVLTTKISQPSNLGTELVVDPRENSS